MFSNERTNTTRTVTADEISIWKVQELKNFCKEHKIKGYSKLRKAELIALITDFLATHKTAAAGAKSRLSVKPEPLTENFRKTAIPGMREYLKKRKLAEEKEVLRCWRSVLLTLTENVKAGALEAEIEAVKRSINSCERRIAEFEARKTKIDFDFKEAVSTAAIYAENFRKALTARKNRKAA